MDLRKLLEINYRTHSSLLEILQRLSSTSFPIETSLSHEFYAYLQSTFIVSNLDIKTLLRRSEQSTPRTVKMTMGKATNMDQHDEMKSLYLPNNHVDPDNNDGIENGLEGTNLLIKRAIIMTERFENEMKIFRKIEKPYLNLFYCIIGESLMVDLIKYCSIFRYDSELNCLYLISGKEFYLKCQKRSFSSEATIESALFRFWSRVPSQFIRIFPYLNVDSDQINNEQWQEYLDDRNLYTEYKRAPYTRPLLINRKEMFYSRHSNGRAKSKMFPFEKLSIDNHNDDYDADWLPKAKQQIFGYNQSLYSCRKNRNNRIDFLLKRIYENYHRMNIESVLRHCCRCSTTSKSLRSSSSSCSVSLSSSIHIDHKSLFKFIYSCYYYIFPVELFGCKHNFRSFYENLKILFLTNSITELRTWDIITGLKLNSLKQSLKDIYEEFSYEQNINNNVQYAINDRNRISNRFEILLLNWVFDVLKQIVRSKFYITESSHLKYSTLYFRYDHWASLTNKFIRGNIERKHWKLSYNDMNENNHHPNKESLYSSKSLNARNSSTFKLNGLENDDEDGIGYNRDCRLACTDLTKYLRCSLLRLVPKKRGLRPISRLQFAKRNLMNNFKLQANSILSLLRYLNQTSFGDKSTRLHYNTDFHRKLIAMKLANEMLNNNSAMIANDENRSEKYYIIRGDFENCYGSIDLRKMLKIIIILIEKVTKDWNCKRIRIGNYLVPKITVLESINLLRKTGKYYSKKSLVVLCSPNDLEKNKKMNWERRNRTEEDADDGTHSIIDKLRGQQFFSDSIKNSIISRKKSDFIKRISTLRLINLLKAYLLQNIVRIGHKTNGHYLYGLRQGGILSAELSEMYLANVWQTQVVPWLDQKDLFVHFSDDFLFISPDAEKAKKFLKIINEFEPLYNLRVQKEKLLMNFKERNSSGKNLQIVMDFSISFLGRTIKLTRTTSQSLSAQSISIRLDFQSFVAQKITDTYNCNLFKPVLSIMKILIGKLLNFFSKIDFDPLFHPFQIFSLPCLFFLNSFLF